MSGRCLFSERFSLELVEILDQLENKLLAKVIRMSIRERVNDAPQKLQSNRADSLAVLLPASDGTGAEGMDIRLPRPESKRHKARCAAGLRSPAQNARSLECPRHRGASRRVLEIT